MGHGQSRNFEDGLPLSAGNRLQDSAHDPRRTLASHDQLDGSAPSPVRSKTDLRQNSLHVRHRARNDDICTGGIQVPMIARIILRPGTPMFAWQPQIGSPPANDGIGTLLDRSKGGLITLRPLPDEDDCATLGANAATDFC